ncbi:hypothetical protein CASFOL_010736 [Castilleja foliolosa]|uniref:Uncharacterized protein n=1 Tax=Castilleja foliolosa TaxID=1961234 RepID=A0ABD3DUX7_9LAMI
MMTNQEGPDPCDLGRRRLYSGPPPIHDEHPLPPPISSRCSLL